MLTPRVETRTFGTPHLTIPHEIGHIVLAVEQAQVEQAAIEQRDFAGKVVVQQLIEAA